MAQIECKDVSVKYESQEVLKDINLTLKSGEFVCIYGESGSGKSTLMNIIGGLDDDYIGTVTINKKGITIIMVSHDINFAINNASKILHLKKNIKFFGNTEDYAKSEVGKKFIGGAEID